MKGSADGPWNNLLRLTEWHTAEINALRCEARACRDELGALCECLADAGILRGAALHVMLHKRRFRAALEKHPLCSQALFETVLGADPVGITVGLLSGWVSICAATIVSRSAAALLAQIGRAMSEDWCSRIYVCGGTGDGVEVLDTVECFNTATQSWDAIPHMAQRRCDASAHVVGRHLYVCGGANGDSSQHSALNSVLNSVERFDPRIGVWQLMPSMLFARRCAAAGVISDRLYVCGGCDATEQALDLSECFDPGSNSIWEALPLMLEPRALPSAGVISQKLFVCGGSGGGAWGQLNSAEVFDQTEGSWKPLPPMCEPRSGASAAAVGARLYVCGGMGRSSVESFDACSNVWAAEPPASVPRYGAAAAPSMRCLYVFGGSHGWQHLASAERFDPASGTWSPLPPMSEKRMAPAVATASDRNHHRQLL